DRHLQLQACPMNWPLGMGTDFRGVFDRRARQLHLFERVAGGSFRAPVTVVNDLSEEAAPHLPPGILKKALDETAMLDAAGESFDLAAIKAGDMTPVFFGSARNNFGVQLLLDGFLELSSPPRTQLTVSGPIAPDDPRFSGFVFKIQSNMDPRHRDQLAFVRVCSGRFQRDMRVFHPRTGESVRLSSSHKLLGRERETVDEAYAGDVIGIVGHAQFQVGDTLTEDKSILYRGIPRFLPEHLAYLHCADTAQSKRFRTGLEHLLQEGVVQPFSLHGASSGVPLLGAVGPLQFEVLQYRLQAEYGAKSRLEPAPWQVVRWVGPACAGEVKEDELPLDARLAADADGRPVLLFAKEWDCGYYLKHHPKVTLLRLPPGATLAAGN
ncbi:MAG: peptide chain release factor 3, partial [Elusimicrobia bacterium RIFOXYA2_FULL_69_6]